MTLNELFTNCHGSINNPGQPCNFYYHFIVYNDLLGFFFTSDLVHLG